MSKIGVIMKENIMTKNQKKILTYINKTFDLNDKELILDYDDNSVVIVDNLIDLTLIFHFVYINEQIILISDRSKNSFA